MPFRISRLLWMAGRPPAFTTGTSGFRCSHSGAVRSVSYGLRQVIGAHQHTGPTLFKRPVKQVDGVDVASENKTPSHSRERSKEPPWATQPHLKKRIIPQISWREFA